MSQRGVNARKTNQLMPSAEKISEKTINSNMKQGATTKPKMAPGLELKQPKSIYKLQDQHSDQQKGR
jgi:hypothetical protein